MVRGFGQNCQTDSSLRTSMHLVVHDHQMFLQGIFNGFSVAKIVSTTQEDTTGLNFQKNL